MFLLLRRSVGRHHLLGDLPHLLPDLCHLGLDKGLHFLAKLLEEILLAFVAAVAFQGILGDVVEGTPEGDGDSG